MSAKRDMMRKIEAKAKRKKQLTKELSVEKTVAYLVADFFHDLEGVKHVDPTGHLIQSATDKLTAALRRVDAQVCLIYDLMPEQGEPRVVIQWSDDYIRKNNCEAMTTLDAASAFFQDAIDLL